MMWLVGPDCSVDTWCWKGDFYLMRFVERDNATCGIAALEEKIEANTEECAGRALVDKRAA